MNTQVKSNRGRKPKLATFNSVVAAVLLALISIVTPLGFAQTANTGAVAGTVTDSSGAVVVGADLALTNSATGEIRHVISGNDGDYLAPQLPPGSYKVEASKAGFKLASFPKITVNVTETERLNVRLVPGNVYANGTVNANAEPLQT